MINVIARIMCMRSQVTECEEKNNQRIQMKMINKDRVYGETTNDRLIFNEEDGFRLSNGTNSLNSEQISNLQQELKQTAALEKDIKEIKTYMKMLMQKQAQKETKEKISREWKLLALVIDRLFFITYLLIIVVSVLTVFDFVLFGGDAYDNN